jgi:DNA replication initiation complex subunit (GINS family)
MRDSEDYFNRLLELRRLEMRSRTPIGLPPDFYESTRRYLQSLDDLLTTEFKEHPTSPRAEAIHQLRQRALGAARDLMEWRMEKICQRAYKVATQGEEPAHLLPEEAALLKSLAEPVLGFGQRFAPYLLPAAPAAPPSGPPAAVVPPTAPPAVVPPLPEERLPVGTPAGISPPLAGPTGPWVTLRILKDGPSVLVGPEESVDLHAEDLLLLPPEKARILVRSGHAEEVRSRSPLLGTAPVTDAVR